MDNNKQSMETGNDSAASGKPAKKKGILSIVIGWILIALQVIAVIGGVPMMGHAGLAGCFLPALLF